MELGVFEPPTSWVRSKGSASESKLQKVSVCRDYKGRLVSAFRPKSRRICADIHADMRGFGHERPLVPNVAGTRFELLAVELSALSADATTRKLWGSLTAKAN